MFNELLSCNLCRPSAQLDCWRLVLHNLRKVIIDFTLLGRINVIADNKEGAYRQHYCKHHRNNNIDFSAHFLLPFHIVSLRRGQIPAILRIPQLDTLHKIRSISTTEQFLRCIEVFPAFFCESIPEIKGKVADLDCATCLPKVISSGVSGKFFSDHSVISSGCTSAKLLFIAKPQPPCA